MELTEVNADIIPHITTTAAINNLGLGMACMIKFEGTCIWNRQSGPAVSSDRSVLRKVDTKRREGGKRAYSDVSGEEDGQRGCVLGIGERKVSLKTLETGIG